MKPFCHAVAPITLATEQVGLRVVSSILAVAIEEAENLCLLASF